MSHNAASEIDNMTKLPKGKSTSTYCTHLPMPAASNIRSQMELQEHTRDPGHSHVNLIQAGLKVQKALIQLEA